MFWQPLNEGWRLSPVPAKLQWQSTHVSFTGTAVSLLPSALGPAGLNAMRPDAPWSYGPADSCRHWLCYPHHDSNTDTTASALSLIPPGIRRCSQANEIFGHLDKSINFCTAFWALSGWAQLRKSCCCRWKPQGIMCSLTVLQGGVPKHPAASCSSWPKGQKKGPSTHQGRRGNISCT